MQSQLRDRPSKRAIILKNRRCAYCGTELTKEISTQDHVVGRRFVPKGKLNAQWNLILNACRPCNNKKSDLEDDVAAITLLPDLDGQFPHNDAAAMEDARRRAAKSISRRTRKPVSQSHETLKVQGSFGPGITANFGFVSPPQIDELRAFELARLHLTAIFFMQTYDNETLEGGWWLHGYHPVSMARRGDWGNVTMRGFMTAIKDWDCRLHAITADGFFKAMTRHHPESDCWAWAIEWNHSLRLIGFFGEREPAQETFDGFPRSEMKSVFEAPGRWFRYCEDTTLSEADDTVFQYPMAEDQGGRSSINGAA
jgi:hypothetical protein